MKGNGLFTSLVSLSLEENGRLDGGNDTICGPIELPPGFGLSNIRIDGDLIVNSRCYLSNVSVFNGSLKTDQNVDKVSVEWSTFDNRDGSAVMHAGLGIRFHGCKFYGKVGFDQFGGGRTNLRHCEFYSEQAIHQTLGFIHVTNSIISARKRAVFSVGGSFLSQHNTWSRKTSWWNRSTARTVELIEGTKYKSSDDLIEGRWLITPTTCPTLSRPVWSTAASK